MINEDDILEKTLFHKDYNLDGKDNISQIPKEPAVFGLCAMIHEKPTHCRYIGETANLQQTIRGLFEKAGEVSEGFEKFMHGPWIKRMVYGLMPGSSPGDRQKEAEEWTKKYNPRCDENGEYPKERKERRSRD
jgi:hypothetical protein